MCGDICIGFIDFMPKGKMLSKKFAMCGSNQINNQLKNYTNQLLENLKNEKHTYLLKKDFRVLITYMQLISKFEKRNRFLLCFIDIYGKYTWVVKTKKVLQLHYFQRS